MTMATKAGETGMQLIESITELLNEEKWTRATLNNYTVANFSDLDALIEQISGKEESDAVLELCNEHLHHTKNSIIALYISGRIKIRRQNVDDANLVSLIEIFIDNHKWAIVRYLCERILDHGENKFALRTLADSYNNDNLVDEMFAIWERLIRIDFDEADIVKQLAEYKEKKGLADEALGYYKKALHRYIAKKSFSSIKEIWHKLIKDSPGETEFFFHAERKISRALSEERAIQLLEDLYPHFRQEEDYHTAITILKRVLTYDARNPWARKEITECYRELYSHHSHLEEYIKLSNLNQSWRNVHDAIADFEKHISFDAGNFVFHRSWGVGLIRGINDDEITIDFVKRRNHNMSLKMAVSALTVLPKDHIWVLKTTRKKDRLRKEVKKSPEWALEIIIKSMNNAADMKVIKSELVPSILTQGEWSSWSTRAREILKTDERFGNVPDKVDSYSVREQPITLEEKMYNRFKAEKNFFDRAKTLFEFLRYVERGDVEATDTEFVREMVDYFSGYLRSVTEVNEQTFGSVLVLQRVVAEHPYLNPGVNLAFDEYLEHASNIEEIFRNLANTDLRRSFLRQLRKHHSQWEEIFVNVFPYYLSKELLDDLESAGKTDALRKIYRQISEGYRDYREAFVWLARHSDEIKWYETIGLGYEKMLINLVHILDLTFRDIENRRDVTENRRINRQIQTFLFKDRRLAEALETVDEDSIQRIYTLVEDVAGLDPTIGLDLKNIVLKRFPDFRFYSDQGPETVHRGGFMAVASSYEAKKKELELIHSVEVPRNSQEIATAREYGDLKENAEYKAAKERQEQLNNDAARLTEDLQRVSIVRAQDVDSEVISFGTKVTLRDLRKNETVAFTILGPWESDPDNGVINYQSPLGKALYDHKVGELLEFSVGDHEYKYEVKEIAPVL